MAYNRPKKNHDMESKVTAHDDYVAAQAQRMLTGKTPYRCPTCKEMLALTMTEWAFHRMSHEKDQRAGLAEPQEWSARA